MPKWVPRLSSVVWHIFAIVLTAAAGLYLAIHADANPVSIVAYLLALVLCFIVLFYGEGAEVAVAMLSDKDPDQVPQDLRAGFEKLQRSRIAGPHSSFISGRQLLVAGAIVALTLLCNDLSHIGSFHPKSPILARARVLLGREDIAFFFVCLFPVLVPLWLAQLPPKFLAHENPLRTYSWQLTRVGVYWAIVFGEHFRIDAPSLWFTRLLAKLQPDVKAIGPGRRHYYETSAMLRGGKGITRAHVELQIGADGSVDAIERMRYRAFVKDKLRTFPQKVYWEGPITHRSLVALDYPPDVGGESLQYPDPSNPAKETVDGVEWHTAEWNVSFQQPLPVGAECEIELRYSAGPGAVKSAVGQPDWYFYTVKLVPHAEVIVEVTPKKGTPFILMDASVEAQTTEDAQTNAAEAGRVEIKSIGDGTGYRYSVPYPLLATEFKFKWRLEPRA